MKIVQIDGINNQVTYSNDITQHRKISKLTPEELIRAYLVTSLITQKHYPRNCIELEKSYKVGRSEKGTEARVDILVKKNDSPFMLIEVKRQDRYEPELVAQIETQLYAPAHLEDPQGKNMRYLVYYTADATEEVGITERTTCIDFQHYQTFEQWEKDGQPNLLSVPIEYGIVKKPVFVKDGPQDLKVNVSRKELEGLRWNIHNILYGGGKYQTELFFNLLGILLAKIYDEKTTHSKQPYAFQIFYKNGDMESPEEVYVKVDDLYRHALKDLLGYTDSEVSKEKGIVFDAPKVKYVVDLLQGISITSNTYDVLGEFFEKIVWQEFKQSKGQYFTHPNIVNFIIRVLELDTLAVKLLENELRLPYIIDASCGSGTYLIEAMKLVTSSILENTESLNKSQILKEFIGTHFPLSKENYWANEFIYGVEINKDLAMATKVNMVMHGDGSANIEAKDALVNFNSYKSILKNYQQSKVYSKLVNEQFDVAISNPPFSIMIERDTAKTLPDNFEQGEKIAKRLKQDSKKKEINVETLFIERWYQLLRPNGRLGVVLPENIFDSTENRAIRLFLFKYFKIKAVVSLPDLAFEPYTSTKTSLLFAQKKTAIEVEEYQQAWKSLEEEYIKLRRQIDLIMQKATSLESYDDCAILFAKFLHDRFESQDSRLSTRALIAKYAKTVKEMDSDWWVFAEISKTINYPIFMAHASEIGYKRVLRREIQRPNQLFDKVNQEIKSNQKPKTILDYSRINVQWE